MKNYLIVPVLLICFCGFGQLKSVVFNSNTRDVIPYVNIWVRNKNIGTTSNQKGEFELNIDSSELIVFSALGFETLEIKSGSIGSHIELTPKTTELEEVFINSEKKHQERIIGKFRKSKINHYFACGETPWIVARFFEYKEIYENTPFLKSIKVLTKSDVKDAQFNIRFYEVDDKGEPGDYLYSKNSPGVARKGKKITEIDLSDLNLQFPKKGFFIAVEWLIIEQNKHDFTYTQKGSRKKLKGLSFEPSFGADSPDKAQNSWIFTQGKWRQLKGNTLNTQNLIAIELSLNN